MDYKYCTQTMNTNIELKLDTFSRLASSNKKTCKPFLVEPAMLLVHLITLYKTQKPNIPTFLYSRLDKMPTK